MKKETLDYLTELMNAPSPSGYEDKARAIWRAEMKKIADEVRGDTHGNSIAVLNAKGAPRVMLAGHIDEIGFQVGYINPEGFISFKTIGGFDVQIIPGRRVVIHTAKGPVKGVTGKKAIHLMTPEDRKKPPKIEELWIDTGLGNAKEVKKVVSIGDPITYADGFERLAKSVYVSRGADDRIGAFVVGEALRYVKTKTLSASVYAVATVQEEVGLRGARTSTFGVDPDVGIAVDVTFATCQPDADKKKIGEITMGKGPVLTRGANVNPKLYDLIKSVAKRKKIKIQLDAQAGGTGTDANAIQLTRAGVATSLISIPTRYIHTPVELLDIRDVEGTIKLIGETICALKKGSNFVI